MTSQKTSVQVFLEEQLKDREVAESFYQGLDELRLAVKIAQLRKQRGLTQAQLAAKLDTSTPVISRLENRGNCTISTLKKVAAALDAVVQIDIVSKEGNSKNVNPLLIKSFSKENAPASLCRGVFVCRVGKYLF